MSSFCGLIKEIPGISVDRFTNENLNSSVYFLSHCHTDHMCGLDNSFFVHLKQNTKYLYCSPISKVFLEATYSEECIKDIAINEKILIEYKDRNGDKDVFFVTCISAGHCPGSVMFLFEKDDKLILYTGDFRLNPLDYTKIAPLHYKNSSNNMLPRKLTKIYLDTTFLDPDFRTFPIRQECVNVICGVIVKWLKKSPMNVVVLECSALYGSEFLYMELSKSLNIPIHVKDRVYSSYVRIPDLKCHVTHEALATPLHACMEKLQRQCLTCRPDTLRDNILTIVPSTLKWKGKDTSVIGEWDNVRERTFNVCYSMHASFNELKAFIRYFEAKEIFPCVLPKNRFEHSVYYMLEKIKSKNTSKDSKKYTLQVLTHEDINKPWAENY